MPTSPDPTTPAANPTGEPTSALVLGGGGIGAAVARRLARRHAVTITYFDDKARAETLVEELSGAERSVTALHCDARDHGSLVAAFDQAVQAGDLRTVVFCVGGWDYPKLVDLTPKQIDDSLALNLRSALLTLAECAHRVADHGRVVLLSSAAADVAPARQSTYAAAKAGLEVAARVAAKELAPRGITVNVVRPGSTDTDTLRNGTSEKAIEAMASSNAMRRLGTPDDIAGVVDMLLSPDAGWATGVIVDATGGLR